MTSTLQPRAEADKLSAAKAKALSVQALLGHYQLLCKAKEPPISDSLFRAYVVLDLAFSDSTKQCLEQIFQSHECACITKINLLIIAKTTFAKVTI